MKRKTFLKTTALASAASGLLPQNLLWANATNPAPGNLPGVGIGLFSVPKDLETDFEGTLAYLANMGYTSVELFGPYPFSSPAGKARWKQVSPSLGFSGSGYFGRSVQEVKALFEEYGLLVPAMHTDLDTLEFQMGDLQEAAMQLGAEYVILPAIPEERRQTLDDYKRMADTFNTIGKKAQEAGIMFAYHNHGYGLSEVNGQIPLQVLLANTDPELVFLEMDLFWTVAGKADPIAYLNKYSGRYKAMHIKDMKALKTFSGDGGTADQWIPLFPNMTSAGSGVLDLKHILATALDNGVEHFFVEQDMVRDPKTALKKSIDYLNSL